MLTKEECINALEYLDCLTPGRTGVSALLTIDKLIKEHFDNPPLKFEELKEHMWVWDNKIKQYYQISCVFKDNREMATYGLMNGFVLFEENRFYRKQVLDE